jgi:FkbM family methyltransferase
MISIINPHFSGIEGSSAKISIKDFSMYKLKKIRNIALKRIPLIQRLLLIISHYELLPKIFWSKLQPIGLHRLNLSGGQYFYYFCYENDPFARKIIWTNMKDWDETTIPVFCEIAKQSEVFFDIGAYTGIYSLLASSVNRAVQIVAFEPNPGIYPYLLRNISVNNLTDRVKAEKLALSDKNGLGHFYVPSDVTAARLLNNKITGSFEVKTITGDNYWLGKLDLIKIDVEGYEINVLKGIQNLLTKHHPCMFIECLNKEKFFDLQNFLSPFGYDYFYYISPNGLITIRNSKEWNPVSRYPNYICSVIPLPENCFIPKQ